MKTKISILPIILILSVLLSACSGVSLQLPGVSAQVLAAGLNSNTSSQAQQQVPTVTAPSDSGLLAAYQNTLVSIYEWVNPSVVNIRVLLPVSAVDLQQIPGNPFNAPSSPGNPDSETPQTPQYDQALGSGFVWDQTGNIVTNNHVVNGASKIEVAFQDGTIVPAKLVGSDPYSDLAVIKVDLPPEQLRPISLADSSQVKVGQLAIAIGNPFGLEGTMTVGIVSALGRTLPVTEGIQSGPVYSIPDIIQTDAPINPGNSGGVLVNDQGQVIGVTAAIESPVRANAGIGFVIPSAIVQKVVPTLIKTGSYEHTWIGISAISLNPDLAKAMGLDEKQRGALVAEITPGSPAEKAGLKASTSKVSIDGQDVNVGGDIIIAIDDNKVIEMDDLIAYLASNTEVGEKVALTIIRDGSEQKVEVELAARPGQETATAPVAQQQTASVWLGIAGIPVNSAIAKSMELPEDQAGVLVEQVESNSPADKAGLKGGTKQVEINGERILVGGDIIIAVNDQPVSQVEELRAILQQFDPGQEVTLTILRQGKEMNLSVTLVERPSN